MKRRSRSLSLLAMLALTACAGYGLTAATGNAAPPFGSEADVRYAAQLWNALAEQRLVGEHTIVTWPYEGSPPHGAILELYVTKVTIGGHTGTAIIKKNYRGENLTVEAVASDPARYLKSITVMYRRETGYDPDNQNWFWVKYTPDGGLMTNPKGMKLAGRVAKGAPKGCIACHSSAPGGDYVYRPIRFE